MGKEMQLSFSSQVLMNRTRNDSVLTKISRLIIQATSARTV